MPARPRHFPFLAGQPLRMGVAAIPEAEWFELDEDYTPQMAEKNRLLRENRAAVFQARPEAAAASAELLAAMTRWVAETHGAGFALARDAMHCPDGRRVSLTGAHPLETASRLVQEDLCLLQADAGGALVLAAASLCFPSRWILAEKLGRPMLAIHAPVPGLNAKLGATIDRFLAGLKAGTIYARTNWSLTTDPALFQPVALPHAPVSVEEAGARVFYRVERQTLRRLEETGAVLFGIRIHQHPLAALKGDAEVSRAFAAALAELDPSLVAYKSMAAIRRAAVEYLRRAGG